MVRGGGGGRAEASTAAAAAAAAPVAKKQSRFVVRDLDAEDVLPGLSSLSIADDRRTDASGSSSKGKGKTSSSRRVESDVGGNDGSDNSGPVASRTRGKEREREAGGRGGEAPPRPAGAAATPAKPSARRPSSSSSSSPSPTLSRYGVALGQCDRLRLLGLQKIGWMVRILYNINVSPPNPNKNADYEPPSEQDVLAHGLHLAGESGEDEDATVVATMMKEQEREALVRPWTEFGALIR